MSLKEEFGIFMPIITIAAIVIGLIILFKFAFIFFKRGLLKKAKTKEQISNIKFFSRIINIAVIIMLVLFGFLSYLKSWTGIGVAVGLITAALGFALQKPITGIAAWIMVIFKRPFNIGDRITLAGFKGDVYDISLTHLYLDEVGTLAESEQHSGRNIMIPNYLLFEQTIINHTLLNDFVLNEIKFSITYDSNLDKAMEIAHKCTDLLTAKYSHAMKKETKVRLSFSTNGIEVRALYYAPVQSMSQIKTDIIKKIHDLILIENEIDFAYPHSDHINKKIGVNPKKEIKKKKIHQNINKSTSL